AGPGGPAGADRPEGRRWPDPDGPDCRRPGTVRRGRRVCPAGLEDLYAILSGTAPRPAYSDRPGDPGRDRREAVEAGHRRSLPLPRLQLVESTLRVLLRPPRGAVRAADHPACPQQHHAGGRLASARPRRGGGYPGGAGAQFPALGAPRHGATRAGHGRAGARRRRCGVRGTRTRWWSARLLRRTPARTVRRPRITIEPRGWTNCGRQVRRRPPRPGL